MIGNRKGDVTLRFMSFPPFPMDASIAESSKAQFDQEVE